jgi:hypothetical protein
MVVLFSLENGLRLHSVQYYETTMITSIENNIKMHFFDYINRFIFLIIKTYTKTSLMVRVKPVKNSGNHYKNWMSLRKTLSKTRCYAIQNTMHG